MPIASGGELYPPPANRGEVVAAWRELSNRVLAELPEITNGVQRARHGGSQVGDQAAGVESAGNELVGVVESSRPSGEQGDIAAANNASAGVSHDMGRAVGKANDPNTNTGPLDAEAANRAARTGSTDIQRGANELGHHPEPGPGDTPGEGPGRI